MDWRKMRAQAQVLRNKKSTNAGYQVTSQGVVRSDKPLPPKQKQVTMAPPSRVEMMRMDAEQILQQRRDLLAMKKTQTNQQTSQPQNKPPVVNKPKPKGGCSGCRRKQGN